MILARADSERQVHQAQSLWSACQALWASVRTGEPGVSMQERLRPLEGEVAAVSRAGGILRNKIKKKIALLNVCLYFCRRR